VASDTRIQVPANGALTLGLSCVDKSTPGRTTWRMRADERFANPAGVMQGGFLAALADEAMGAATITHVGAEPVFSSNVELKISLMRKVTIGTWLTATGWVVSAGRRVAFCEAEIVDDTGAIVARSSSTYVLRPRARADAQAAATGGDGAAEPSVAAADA
jgi:uncharacterized protein (TIGR00369 family)